MIHNYIVIQSITCLHTSYNFSGEAIKADTSDCAIHKKTSAEDVQVSHCLRNNGKLIIVYYVQPDSVFYNLVFDRILLALYFAYMSAITYVHL